MGSYVTYDELVGRYALFASWGGSEGAIEANLITYAEAEINQRFGPHFSVPFSPVHLSVKDITLDLAYCKGLRGKDKTEKTTQVCSDVYHRIDMMLTEGIVTDSGTIVSPDGARSEIWSSTEDYVPTHSMLGAEDAATHVDSDLQQNLEDERK